MFYSLESRLGKFFPNQTETNHWVAIFLFFNWPNLNSVILNLDLAMVGKWLDMVVAVGRLWLVAVGCGWL